MSVYDGNAPEQIEAYRKYHRERYGAHKEEICKRRRENYQYDCAHGGAIRAYNAEYGKTHRGQQRQANRRNYEKRKAYYAALEADNARLKEEVRRLRTQLLKT